MRDETKITSDITVYGATGFVGKYICDYLVESANKANEEVPLKLVFAGRNKTKLQQLLASFDVDGKSSTVEICVVDSSDLEGLTKMADTTKVVIAAAGPFEKYGTNVVAACAKTGADYVDITGEFYWVAKMRQQFGEAAKASGARIIPLCGYDSIPTDMSVFGAVEALRASAHGAAQKIEVQSGKSWHYFTSAPTAGTLHTFLGFPVDPRHMFLDKNNNGSLRKTPYLLDDPLCMTHPTLVRHNPDYTERKNVCAMSEWYNLLPSFDGVLCGGMSMGFTVAPINMKVVYSSATALNYGPNFTLRERWVPFGFRFTRTLGILSVIPVMMAQCVIAIVGCILMLPKLVETFYPPGSGPPKVLSQACSTEVYSEVVASSSQQVGGGARRDGKKVDRAGCHIYFEGDASNLVTSQCVCESALALLYNRKELPRKSQDGFGTPAELLGKVLLTRLKENKVRKVVIETAVQTDGPKLNLKLLA